MAPSAREAGWVAPIQSPPNSPAAPGDRRDREELTRASRVAGVPWSALVRPLKPLVPRRGYESSWSASICFAAGPAEKDCPGKVNGRTVIRGGACAASPPRTSTSIVGASITATTCTILQAGSSSPKSARSEPNREGPNRLRGQGCSGAREAPRERRGLQPRGLPDVQGCRGAGVPSEAQADRGFETDRRLSMRVVRGEPSRSRSCLSRTVMAAGTGRLARRSKVVMRQRRLPRPPSLGTALRGVRDWTRSRDPGRPPFASTVHRVARVNGHAGRNEQHAGRLLTSAVSAPGL